jgi:hypothetical protein
MAHNRSQSPDPLDGYDIPTLKSSSTQISNDQSQSKPPTRTSTSNKASTSRSIPIRTDQTSSEAHQASSKSSVHSPILQSSSTTLSRQISSDQNPSKPSSTIQNVSTSKSGSNKATSTTSKPSKSLSEHLSGPSHPSTSSHRVGFVSQTSGSSSKPLEERLSSPPPDIVSVGAKAQSLDDIVASFRNEEIDSTTALRKIRDLTFNDFPVSEDYVSQILTIQREQIDFKREQKAKQAGKEKDTGYVEAVNEAAWAALESQVQENENELALLDSTPPPQDNVDILQAGKDALARLLSQNSKPTSSSSLLPASLLEAAPYLANLSGPTSQPGHVQKTWELKSLFASDTNLDPIVSLLSAQPFSDPLPITLLHLIVKDRFVDFEKIHASFASFSSSIHDDSKDFGSEFKLVRKEQVIRSLPVTTESQWLRVFEAWLAPLLKVYPHRQQELDSYKSQIMDYFRSAPNDPLVAIRVDKEARQKAANTPFDLGNPENFHTLLLKEMLSTRKRSSTSTFSSSTPSSKRRDTPCILWNENRCSDPCPNSRKHGYCSECGESHKAIDHQSCYSKLQKRRSEGRKRSTRS